MSGTSIGRFTSMMISAPFVWPAPGNYNITSEWGWRAGTRNRWHDGIDMNHSGCRNTGGHNCGINCRVPIVATSAGRVVVAVSNRTNYTTGYGNRVVIEHTIHGRVFFSVYAHLHAVTVRVGDVVAQGQQIGTMGNTGSSTGTHLHFEIRQVQSHGVGNNRGRSVNPIQQYHRDDHRRGWTNPNPVFIRNGNASSPFVFDPTFEFDWFTRDILRYRYFTQTR